MIIAYCIRGNGDKEMSEIEDSFLTSVSDAVRRGKYEIDKQWFFVRSQSLDVPLKKRDDDINAIMDNDIVTIYDGELGLSGNRRVTGITINGTPSDVSMNLVVKKFEDYL